RFVQARHLHLVEELRLALVDNAGDGRGAGRLRRAREGDVTFAREQTGGGVELNPPRAGEIDFAPGVQVGEVRFSAGRAVERFHVRLERNEIARHEAGREAEVPKNLDQQPAGVAAGSGAQGQSFLWRLHAGFKADEVFDFLRKAAVKADEKIIRAHFRPV